jgi:hypothetical protein
MSIIEIYVAVTLGLTGIGVLVWPFIEFYTTLFIGSRHAK